METSVPLAGFQTFIIAAKSELLAFPSGGGHCEQPKVIGFSSAVHKKSFHKAFLGVAPAWALTKGNLGHFQLAHTATAVARRPAVIAGAASP